MIENLPERYNQVLRLENAQVVGDQADQASKEAEGGKSTSGKPPQPKRRRRVSGQLPPGMIFCKFGPFLALKKRPVKSHVNLPLAS